MRKIKKKSKKEYSNTPRVTRSVVTRRNLLAALTGSKKTPKPNPLNPSTGFGIAHQKEQARLKKERQEMARTLEKLIDRMDLIKEKLFRIKDAIAEDAENNIHFLNLQLLTIQKAYEEFDSLYSEAVSLVTKDEKGEWKTDYLNFESLHANLYVTVQTKIADLQRGESSRALTLNANASEFQPRTQVVHSVPHLQVPLPTFDGKLENWYSFKCMFQTVMGRYPNESPAIKLYHLRNSLIGSASGKIDQEVINNNGECWKTHMKMSD